MTRNDEEIIKKILAGAVIGGVIAGSGGVIVGGLLAPAVIDVLKKIEW